VAKPGVALKKIHFYPGGSLALIKSSTLFNRIASLRARYPGP